MELPNILRLDNFYTPKQYEKAANISINTTRNRIKNRLISCIRIDGRDYIDIEKSPPDKCYHSKITQPSNPSFPTDIDKSQLVHVPSYARRKRKTPDKLFEAILAGKIFGLVIGGEAFAYKKELETI